MADAGIKVWDADGNQIIGPFTSIGIVVGWVDTGKANGSLNVSALGIGGTPLIVAVLPISGGFSGTGFGIDITISPTSISWAFPTNNANWNTPMRIFYGVA